jgi:hypothetical protein
MTEEETKEFVKGLNEVIAHTMELTGLLKKHVKCIEMHIDFLVAGLNK